MLEVSGVLHIHLHLTGIECPWLAELGQQNLKCPARLLPTRHVGLVARRCPQPFSAAIAEVEAARLAVFIEVRPALSVHHIQGRYPAVSAPTVVMRMGIELKDVYPQWIVGSTMPTGQHRR